MSEVTKITIEWVPDTRGHYWRTRVYCSDGSVTIRQPHGINSILRDAYQTAKEHGPRATIDLRGPAIGVLQALIWETA